MTGGPDWLRLKGKAELRSDEKGYTGAWFEVVIAELNPTKKQARVRYMHFVADEATGEPHAEVVKVDNLRPLPPPMPSRKWKERDSVETYYNSAWWVGYIKGRVPHLPDKYWVYYGKGEEDLQIHARHIRPRQNYLRPSPDCPNGSWSTARPMQSPAIWDRIEEARPVVKRPAVGKIQPRARAPASREEDESDDSWDTRDERCQKRKPKRTPTKTTPPKRTKIRFVSRPKTLTITHALPAVNPPPKAAAEQSTLVLTPGSSPPLADSPAVSPLAQKPLTSPPTRSSSSNNSSSSGGSGSSSSGEEEDDDDGDGDGDQSAEEDVSIGGRMSSGIFPDFSNDEESARNKKAYQQLLECFKHDSKGMLDMQRHNILTAVREELKLSTQDVNVAHCLVFGMPLY